MGKIGEKELLAVHYRTKVERGFLLRHDRPHDLVGEEDVKLARDIRNDVFEGGLASRLLGDLAPELHDDRILAPRELEIAEIAVGEYAPDFE